MLSDQGLRKRNRRRDRLQAPAAACFLGTAIAFPPTRRTWCFCAVRPGLLHPRGALHSDTARLAVPQDHSLLGEAATRHEFNDEQGVFWCVSVGRRVATAAAAVALGGASWLRRKDAASASGLVASAVAAAVEKPPLDARDYTALTLPNGLRVLLVSDPDADSAAAALDVHVGYFNDPDDIPGIAHFCEHMLFLGTKAFPEEGGFDKFLTANGGDSNAYTDNEDTCFFFSCRADALQGALERFGAFFTSPLFTEAATEREVNAITSEHLKNVQNDGFRGSQLISSRANPKHPFHHFGTGTRATLLESPALRGVDARSALLAHYDRWYRAPFMTLCVIGRDRPEVLSAYAQRFFGNIVGAGKEGFQIPSVTWASTPPFLREAFDRGVDVVPASDRRTLQVGFPVAFIADDQPERRGVVAAVLRSDWRRLRPSAHVGSAIGYEGSGSLCAMLRRRGWATGLSFGVSEENASFAIMEITVGLTMEGLARRSEVLQVLFGYLRLLRELPKWPAELVEQNVRLSAAAWATAEEQEAQDSVVRLASNMQEYSDPREYIAGGVRLRGGPVLADSLSAVIAAFTPANALITTNSRSFEGVAGETEPWYGTRFRSWEVLTDRRLWEAAQPIPGLTLPPPNPFLPRSLALKAPRTPRTPRGVAPLAPRERRRDNRWQVFFQQDTEFGVPKAYARFLLRTASPRRDPKAQVASRLYESLLRDGLAETLLYDASVAGLFFEMASSSRGIQLLFGGYNDRLVDFVRATFERIILFDPVVDLPRFEAQRDVLKREYASFGQQPPYQQAGYWSGLATTLPDQSVQDLQAVVPLVGPEDVKRFATRLWQNEQMYGTVLCQGNLSPEDADRLVAVVDDAVKFTPLPEEQWPAATIVKLPATPSGLGCVIANAAMDPAEENSAVDLTFQIGIARAPDKGPGQRKWATVLVLATLLRDKFYSDLRTRQQLGYVVACVPDKREGVVRLAFIVQGAALDPIGVVGRIDTFLEAARQELGALPEVAVQGVAGAIAEARQTRPQQLEESTDLAWLEVRTNEFQWNRVVFESQALQRVTKADVLDVFDLYVRAGGAERRRLVSMVFGAAHRAEFSKAASTLKSLGAEVIDDGQAFARWHPRWTVGGGVIT